MARRISFFGIYYADLYRVGELGYDAEIRENDQSLGTCVFFIDYRLRMFHWKNIH